MIKRMEKITKSNNVPFILKWTKMTNISFILEGVKYNLLVGMNY